MLTGAQITFAYLTPYLTYMSRLVMHAKSSDGKNVWNLSTAG
jgi:hypothetical protein